MDIQLSESLQRALDTQQEEPLRVVDPRTNVVYVLLRAEEFESIREILEDEKRQKDIRAVALRNAVGRMPNAENRP
jgi:hypothetical protein